MANRQQKTKDNGTEKTTGLEVRKVIEKEKGNAQVKCKEDALGMSLGKQ